MFVTSLWLNIQYQFAFVFIFFTQLQVPFVTVGRHILKLCVNNVHSVFWCEFYCM